MLFEGHLLVANWANVVVVAVVDVGPVVVLEALLKGFPGCFGRVLLGHVLRALGLVEDSGLAFDAEVFA